MKYFKNLIFTFFAFIIGFSANGMVTNTAFAVDYVDTATFISLDYKSQVSIIREAQLMAARYENIEINFREKQKIKKYVQNLVNIFISSAYAKSNKVASKVGDICIYAGWVSVYDGEHCTHPFNTDEASFNNILDNVEDLQARDMIEKSRKANIQYRQLHKDCGATGKILCSPHLFGTLNGKPFCADGNKDTLNSSYQCFQTVDKLEKNQKKEVYKSIIDNVTGTDNANTSTLMNMFKIYYDICMCNGDKGYINKDYAGKMFGQRTCYAWMRQTEVIMSNFKGLPGVCNKLSGIEHKENGSAINNMADWLVQAQNNINGVMLNKNIDPKVLFKGELEDGAKQNKIWLESRKKAQDEYEASTKVGTCPVNIITEEPVTPPVIPGDLACTIKAEVQELAKVDQKNKSDTPKVDDNKDAPKKNDKTPEPSKKTEVAAAQLETKEEFLYKDGDVKLIASFAGDDGDYKDAEKTFSWTNAVQNKNNPKEARLDEPKEETKIDLIIDVKTTSGESKKFSCNLNYVPKGEPLPEPEKKKQYTIKAKIAKDNLKSSDLVAVVTADGKELTKEDLSTEGLKVVWTFKDIEPKTDKKKKKESSKTGKSGLPEDDDGRVIASDTDKKDPPVDNGLSDDEDDKEKPSEKKTTKGTEGLTTKRTKKEVKQTATAKLVKAGQEDQESSVEVPKIAKTPEKTPHNNNPQLRGPATPPNKQQPQNYGLRGIR